MTTVQYRVLSIRGNNKERRKRKNDFVQRGNVWGVSKYKIDRCPDLMGSESPRGKVSRIKFYRLTQSFIILYYIILYWILFPIQCITWLYLHHDFYLHSYFISKMITFSCTSHPRPIQISMLIVHNTENLDSWFTHGGIHSFIQHTVPI